MFVRILQYILAAVGVFLLFGMSVLIHEFGHFLSARLLGLRADTFAIGFGPAIWKKKKGDTEYRINWIPFGGYVSLPQLDPEAMNAIQDGATETLPPAVWWKRVIVAFSGPLGNVVLGVLLALLLSVLPWDFSHPGFEHLNGTTIGWVAPGSSSEAAGLRKGDAVLSVGEIPVETYVELVQECHLQSGNDAHEVTVSVSNRLDGVIREMVVPLVTNTLGYYFLPDVEMAHILEIGTPQAGSPAEQVGLAEGDRILRANGEYVFCFGDLTNRLSTVRDSAMKVEVLRDEKPLVVEVTPTWNEEQSRWILGIPLGQLDLSPNQWLKYRHPLKQVKSDAESIFRVLGGLVAPKHEGEAGKVAKELGGPIIILTGIWKCLLTSLIATLAFIRFLNINLAIINLLPIPVLDGGHILFALLEGIFRRKLPPKVLHWIMNIFVFLLLALFAVLMVRDISRFF